LAANQILRLYLLTFERPKKKRLADEYCNES
jgi:hypothetical protein